MNQEVQTPASNYSRLPPLAPRGHRVAAFVIDVLLAGVALGSIAIAERMLSGCDGRHGMGCAWAALIALAVLLVLTLIPLLITQAVLITRRSYTLGMRMVGLRLACINGHAAGFWRGVLLRSLPLVVAPLLAYGLVELVWYLALASIDKQTLLVNWNTYETIKALKFDTVVGLALAMLIVDAAGWFQHDGRSLRDRFAGTVVTRAKPGK